MVEQPLLPFEALPKTLPKGSWVRFSEILPLVCLEFRVSEEELKGYTRKERISHPRQVLMFLAAKDTGRSLSWIGSRIGGRDHTTVLHGRDKIEKLFLQGDEVLVQAIKNIRDKYQI